MSSATLSWIAQVTLLIRTDLSRLRWMLVLYGVALVITSVALFVWMTRLERIEHPGSWPLWIFSAMLVFLIVHDDSPTSHRVQWRTLPLRPSAVLAAKGVLIASIPITLIATEVVLLRVYGVTWTHVARDIAWIVPESVATFLTAALLAAIARNVREYVAGGALLAYMTLPLPHFVRMLPREPGTMGMYLHEGAIAEYAAAAVVFLVVVALYLRSGANPSRIIAAGALIIATLLNSGFPTPIPDSTRDAAPQVTTLPEPTGFSIAVGRFPDDTTQAGTVPVRIVTDPTVPGRFTVSEVTARLQTDSGEYVVPARTSARGFSWSVSGPVSTIAVRQGTRYVSGDSAVAFLSAAHARAIAAGRAKLTIHGIVDVASSIPVVELPLDSAAATWNGRPVKIETSLIGGRPKLVLRWVAISDGRYPYHEHDVSAFLWGSEFVLINRDRTQSYELYLDNAGGYRRAGLPAFDSRAWVVEQHVTAQSSYHYPDRGAVVDAHWLRGATLAILEWEPSRRYRVAIPVR